MASDVDDSDVDEVAAADVADATEKFIRKNSTGKQTYRALRSSGFPAPLAKMEIARVLVTTTWEAAHGSLPDGKVLEYALMHLQNGKTSVEALRAVGIPMEQHVEREEERFLRAQRDEYRREALKRK